MKIYRVVNFQYLWGNSTIIRFLPFLEILYNEVWNFTFPGFFYGIPMRFHFNAESIVPPSCRYMGWILTTFWWFLLISTSIGCLNFFYIKSASQILKTFLAFHKTEKQLILFSQGTSNLYFKCQKWLGLFINKAQKK